MTVKHKRAHLLRFVTQLWFADKTLLAASIGMIVISSLVQLAIPLGGKRLVDATEHKETSFITRDCVVLAVSILCFHFVSLAGHLAAYRMSLRVTTSMLRVGLVAVCDGKWADITTNNPVELGQMILGASKFSGDTLASIITELISSIISAVGILVLVIYLSARLTLMFAMVVACTQLFSHLYSRRFHVSGADFSRREANLQAIIVNSIQRAAAIRIFDCRSEVLRNFDETSAQLVRSGSDLNFGIHFHACVASGVTNVMFVLMIGIAGYYKSRGEFDIADIAIFFFYMKSLLDRVLLIAQEARKLSVMLDKADDFCSFEEKSREMSYDGASGVSRSATDDGASAIRFRSVSYCYDQNGNSTALRNVSFELPTGKLIALSGESGSGKSTILKLLAGLIFPTSGVVERFHDVAMLEQSHSIFIGTIEQNIRFGNRFADDRAVVAAASRAGCKEFIEALPNSFKTFIENPDQAQLSGGQLQRICLARVFLSNATLILLDEPTTGLDEAAAEIVINSAIELRNEGRTVVFASHDARALQSADLVLSVADLTGK